MPSDPSNDDTSPHGLEEGIELAYRAQESGDWKPVVDWLARHPGLAEPLTRFIGGEREVSRVINPPHSAACVGSVLGDFELLNKLDRGHMGVVYRGLNRRYGQEVAIKVIDISGLSQRELAEKRFEVEVMAGLNHPNVVPLFSAGETDGELYIAMPLMTGGSLKGLMDRERGMRRSPKEAAAFVLKLANGIHHAHQLGLIHRDLKPANVLLDRDKNLHVADFGLAHRADASVSGAAGTPAYMAPEQARGERYLTTAVDIHALGVILFELLTGERPFCGKDGPSVLRHIMEDPAPPLTQFRPDVPRDLQTICTRCLKKEPQERYLSAQALADHLTMFLNDESIEEHRGRVSNIVRRALRWRRETGGMSSSRVLFWGGLSTLFAMAVMQVAVLLHAPLWVSQAAIAYYLFAWLSLMWSHLVSPHESLNPVERASTALHFGAKFACMAILSVQLWLHDGDPLYALPLFLVCIGLTSFAHGVFYWGRFYLIGLGEMILAAAMPLVPVTYWPAIYGLALGLLQFWGYFHSRYVSQMAAANRPTIAD